MSESLGTAVLELDANQGPLDAKLNAAQAATEGRLASMSKKVKAAGASLSSASSTLTRRVTLPIIAIGAVTGKMAVDFEKSMRNVNSIAQLPEPAFQRLNKAVLEMSGRTAQAPITLAEGLYDLVSSGFDAKESLVILEASANAATAGLTTTEVSTKAVAAALNAYHRPASDAQAISDDLFQTVNLGVVTFDELASTIGMVLPAAATMGVDIKQVGASISTLTKEGQSGANAVTNINAALTAFIKPSKDMSSLLKELGYETSQQLIHQKGFQGALELVTHAVHGNKEEIGKLFPNVRAMRAVFGLTGASAKAAGKDLRGFQNDTGATAKVLAEQRKSVAFQWNQLKAEGSRLAIEIGKALLPVIVPIFRKIASAISSVGKAFTDASPSVQRFIIIALGIAAAIGPVMGVLAGIVEAVGLLLSPVAAVALGIAALAVVFIHLYTTSSNVRGAISNIVGLLQAFGQAMAPVATGLASVALKILSFGLGLAGTKAGVMVLGAAIGALTGRMIALGVVWAVEKAMAFAATIGAVVSEIRMAIGAVGAFRAATMALSATIDGALISTGIGALLVVAGSVVGALMGMSSATDHAKTSADQLTQSLQAETDAMREIHDLSLELAQRKANLTAANLAVARAQQRVNEMQKSGRQGTLSYREAENSLTQAKIQQKRASKEVARAGEDEAAKERQAAAAKREAIKQGEARIKTLIEEKAAVIASIATEGDSAAKRKQLSTVNEGLSHTTDELGRALGHVPKKAEELANSLGRIPKKKKTEFELKDHNSAHAAQGIVNKVSSALGGLKPKMSRAGRDGSNSLRGGLLGGLGAVIAVAAAVPGRIKGGMGDLGSYLVSAGAALMDGLKNGIVSAASAAAEAAAAAAHSVAAAAKGALGVKSPSRVFEEIGRNVIRGLRNGLSGMGDSFASALKKGLVEPLVGVQKQVERIFDSIHHNVEALTEAVQMTEEVGNLKVEKAREAAEGTGSEGGVEVTAKEQEAVDAVQASVNKEAVVQFKALLAEMQKEAKELPGHINKLNIEARAAGKREKQAREAARKESKRLRSLESKLQHAKTDAEKKALHAEIKTVTKNKTAAEKAASKAEKLRSKLGDRVTELKDRLQELVGATGRGGAIFGTLMALAKLNAIPLSDLPKFATGVTNFAGGPALVGEKGPEIVNLPKGADVLNAHLTERMLGAHRKLSRAMSRQGGSESAGAPRGDDGALRDHTAAINRLLESGTADVIEALVSVVSERQGYKHLRGRRGGAGDGRVAIA